MTSTDQKCRRLLAVFVAVMGTFCLQAGADWFLHRTGTSNLLNNYTLLPTHLTSDRSLHIYYAPRTVPGDEPHLDRNTGLWFPGPMWSIFNEYYLLAMDTRHVFSVHVPQPGDTDFLHVHDASQPFKRSYLDHPSLNSNPNALLFVAHNWDIGGFYNNTRSPVTYDSFTNRWFIHGYIPDDEFTDIPDGAAYNVLIKESSSNAFKHVATAGSISGNHTVLDHPMLNSNPDALILATTEFQSNYLDTEFTRVQPRYLSTIGRWVLEKMSEFDFREDAEFHLFVAAASDTPEPVIDAAALPPRVMLSFDTVYGYTYQMQAAPDPGTWFDEGVPFGGNGHRITYPTAAGLPASNYRLLRTVGIPGP